MRLGNFFKNLFGKAEVAADTAIDKVKEAAVEAMEMAKVTSDKVEDMAEKAYDKVEDIAEDMVEKVKNTLNHSDESDITAEIDPESSETKGAN